MYVPKIYREISGKRVLSMEFVRGVKIDDLKGLEKLGASFKEVRELLIHTFANMTFI